MFRNRLKYEIRMSNSAFYSLKKLHHKQHCTKFRKMMRIRLNSNRKAILTQTRDSDDLKS